MIDLHPDFSHSVAAIIRDYDRQILAKPHAKDRLLKQRQRAIYFHRYPIGQKQKAKVLSQGVFENQTVRYDVRYNLYVGKLHICRIANCYDWRNFLDVVSKPV